VTGVASAPVVIAFSGGKVDLHRAIDRVDLDLMT
jgi:hypothetical protein